MNRSNAIRTQEPSPRILVIEDEPQMLQNLLTILRVESYDAMGAQDGESGLEILPQFRPNLILCDITMPGMGGYGVLERVRANTKTAAIPFLFLTARGERSEVRSGMNLGADDYLTKPVRIDDLLLAIRARLERSGQTSQNDRPSLPENPKELEVLGLTPRECDVLFWLLQGKTNAEIGTILSLSPATAKKHLEHIFAKLSVENRASAISATFQLLVQHR